MPHIEPLAGWRRDHNVARAMRQWSKKLGGSPFLDNKKGTTIGSSSSLTMVSGNHPERLHIFSFLIMSRSRTIGPAVFGAAIRAARRRAPHLHHRDVRMA